MVREVKQVAATPPILKKINLSTIIKIVMKWHPISRTQIAERSGISKPTVTKLVRELFDEGYLVSIGKNKSRVGKRQELLALNPSKGYVISVDIGLRTSKVALISFATSLIVVETIETHPNHKEFLKSLVSKVVEIVRKRKVNEIHAVVVSVPGIVHKNLRIAVNVPLLHWRNIPLADLLELSLMESGVTTTVTLENDAQLGVIAEVMLNQVPSLERKNIVYVLVKEGIGVGMFLNRELYSGRSHTAGEFGHMVIDIDGEECSCGRRGCWITLAGSEQLSRYVQKGRIEEYIRLFGTGLINIINGLDPDVIVISGKVTDYWGDISPLLSHMIMRESFVQEIEDLRIVPSRFENRVAPLVGGAIVGFRDYIEMRGDEGIVVV